MTSQRNPPGRIADSPSQTLFACLFGGLLGLSLCKFGNTVILADKISTPENIYEWVLTSWPLGIGNILLLMVALAGLAAIRKRPDVPLWLALAPLPWIVWQVMALFGSSDFSLSAETFLHLAGCVVCFYLGLYCLSPVVRLRAFWACLLAAYVIVMLIGWHQHFGGLEETRRYFFEEVYPRMKDTVPPELLKRMSSDRIFSTLFYANTLAGAVLLMLPVCVGSATCVFGHPKIRRVAIGLIVTLGLGCLVWSGSKGGWLLMILLGMVALFRVRFPTIWKISLVALLLVAGSAGFVWKYAGYFEKGAKSAVARRDYWEAAVKTTMQHPVLGTGPGTFGHSYEAIRRPESEPAKLTHNDYLQQASDSGVPGCVFYTTFVIGVLTFTGWRAWKLGGIAFWIWLGLLGISAQSLMEFGLYIPAIAWPTFALMGWLVGMTSSYRGSVPASA